MPTAADHRESLVLSGSGDDLTSEDRHHHHRQHHRQQQQTTVRRRGALHSLLVERQEVDGTEHREAKQEADAGNQREVSVAEQLQRKDRFGHAALHDREHRQAQHADQR
jgi:hypothetical protein